MKLSTVLAPLALLAVACSANTVVTDNGGGGGGGNQDRGIDTTGGDATQAPDTNPNGVAYPTDGVGVTVGARIQNFKFLGYPDGNPANGLQPMSMAQFFDPTGTKYKMIHVQASGAWCTYCKQEMKTVIPLAQQLSDRKVVWVVSLAEGNVLGTPAEKADLDRWIGTYKSSYPHFLDSGNKNFGPFYDAAALPWNCNIDAKTMKILSSGVGAATTDKQILDDLDAQLKKIQ